MMNTQTIEITDDFDDLIVSFVMSDDKTTIEVLGDDCESPLSFARKMRKQEFDELILRLQAMRENMVD